jgi:predicted DNA-binding protein YlxM (UPF0122 family)
MTNNEYAAIIYRQVYNRDGDSDVYTRGMMEALKSITHKEQVVLENRFRHRMTLKEAGKEFGISEYAVRYTVKKALARLRHPFRLRMMSMTRVEEERDLYRQASEEAEAMNEKLNRLIFLLVRGMPINEELHAAYDKLEMRVADAGFLPQIAKALCWAKINIVGDLYDVDSYERLMRIRNIGAKYIDSLIARMRELGFNEWADAMESGKG